LGGSGGGNLLDFSRSLFLPSTRRSRAEVDPKIRTSG
jgi:hypothetical protein